MNKHTKLAVGACITDTRNSPNTMLTPLSLGNISMGDGFWSERRRVNREVSLRAIGNFNRRSGRIDNLRRAAGLVGGNYEGIYFNDSDVYKWMEAVFWSLHEAPDADLEAQMEELIEVIAAAQLEDGYINSYFQDGRLDERWTDFSMHEFYCGGHLIQAAIADFRTRGKTDLLDVACKFADHIVERFGDGSVFGAPGHQLIEMALVELFRVTGKSSYLDLSRRLIEIRGSGEIDLHRNLHWKQPSYHQDHVPLRQAHKMAGHAVRQVYYLAGATDCVCEHEDQGLSDALERLWQNMTSAHLYLGGGIGPRWEIEGFGDDFEMPSHHAHCESCASVGSFMWNWRMLQKTGEGRFADLCEHTLYNSAISGVSMDGERFFYQNPLGDSGNHQRQKWFDVACCPSNIARLLAQLPGYMAGMRQGGVAIHFYGSMTLRVPLENGVNFAIKMDTVYPADGNVALKILSDARIPVWLRIPDWALDSVRIEVNGALQEHRAESGYVRIERDWKAGDVIKIQFELKVRRIYANPSVQGLRGRVAIVRGPVVYAWEQHDNADCDISSMLLPETTEIVESGSEIGGLPILEGTVAASNAVRNSDMLYSSSRTEVRREPRLGKAIPYAFWGNRSAGPMEVWLAEKD